MVVKFEKNVCVMGMTGAFTFSVSQEPRQGVHILIRVHADHFNEVTLCAVKQTLRTTIIPDGVTAYSTWPLLTG